MTAHQVRDTEDFRAGMAYAAHVVRHMIDSAHGGNPMDHVARIEHRRCCQGAVIAFAEGMAEGIEDAAGGKVADHDHRETAGSADPDGWVVMGRPDGPSIAS